MPDSSLIVIGAAAALLCPAALASGLVIGSVYGASKQSLSFGAGELLGELNEKRVGYLFRQILFLMGTLFAIPLGLTLYQTLKGAGSFVRIAALAWNFGLILAILNDLLLIVTIAHLLPAYAVRTEASSPALEAIGNVFDRLIRYLQLAGDMLFIGVGVGLFAVAILQTGALHRSLGWFGLLAAVLAGWLNRPVKLLKTSGERLAPVGTFGFLLFMCWLIMVGVRLLR
jgi:hypothetical protein